MRIRTKRKTEKENVLKDNGSNNFLIYLLQALIQFGRAACLIRSNQKVINYNFIVHRTLNPFTDIRRISKLSSAKRPVVRALGRSLSTNKHTTISRRASRSAVRFIRGPHRPKFPLSPF